MGWWRRGERKLSYATVLVALFKVHVRMSSVRLYLLPEYTTEGRQHYHGEVRVQ